MDGTHLERVASALCGRGGSLRFPRPSRQATVAAMEALRGVLFPGYFGTSDLTADTARFHVAATLHHVQEALAEQVSRSLCFVAQREVPGCADEGTRIAGDLIERLPAIQETLMTDVTAAFEGDPAATSPHEAILCYPGLLAIACYRVAHELHRLGVPLLPRLLTEHAHGATGIDIHPGARIGKAFFIDHGTGVVIGETCEVGERVRIYQGVTLGARSFPLDAEGRPIKGIPRHPIVEDDVVIYSGATLLGRITVGRGSVIGGNVWLTQDVPAGSSVTQSAAKRESFHLGGGI